MSGKLTSIRDLLSQAAEAAKISGCERAWIYAAFTDDIYLRKWDPTEKESLHTESILAKENRLLELRLFWEQAEFKAFRGNIGGPFHYRVITEDEGADYYDERQFLEGMDEASRDLENAHANESGRDFEAAHANKSGGDFETAHANKSGEGFETAHANERRRESETVCANENGRDSKAFNANRRGKEIHRLTVRNYVSYYEASGQAYVSDYRMVSIEEGKGKEGKPYAGD